MWPGRASQEELQEIVGILENQEKILDISARIPKGFCWWDRPKRKDFDGSRRWRGKQCPVFHVSGSGSVGAFCRSISASQKSGICLKVAKSAAPAIVSLTEIDASSGRHRGTGLERRERQKGNETLNQNSGEVKWTGFEPARKVIVIAATNRPDVLDPALLRPGKGLTRKVFLDLPDIKRTEKKY